MLESLPIASHLDNICNTLKASPSRFLVLTAETGAGKSTAVPLALLRHFKQKIIMLEPRRIAALAVASRVSELLGEAPGETAGYIMHLERNVSSKTRFTVITESILTRMMQSDPSLEGIDVVVIDEFHERSIHADLALALLKELMILRDDLYVIVMSATINAQGIASYLGSKENPAPIYEVPGKMFPVSIEYKDGISMADAVMQELSSDRTGSILAFLPGIADIKRTEQKLRELNSNAYIQILHSSVSMQDQKKITSPAEQNTHEELSEKRRIILSSAIAETSLTIPDVTVVIDSGLSRINRMNVACGMETLSTETESKFSAKQRMGRAGRTQAGHCIRLWKEHDILPERTPPEILRTDLTQLVLECTLWGVKDRLELDWLDTPPASAWDSSVNLLEQLGCIERTNDGTVTITQKGKNVLQLPLHPRLACTALADNSSEIALKKVLEYSTFSSSAPAVQKRFLDNIRERLKRCQTYPCKTPLLAGFPDRIACNAGDRTYQFPSGRMAQLPKTEQPPYPKWIVAPEADAGERTGLIYRWEPLSEEQAQDFLKERVHTETIAEFADDSFKLKKTQYTQYGKIILAERKLAATQKDFAQAVCNAVKQKGIQWLPLSDKSRLFLLRAEFYMHHSQSEIPQPLEEYLKSRTEEWLVPFITENAISEETVFSALHYFLDGSTIDAKVPERLTVANGRSFRMTYEKNKETGLIKPVLEVIIQQIFGCMETPKVMGIPVLLRLLSPARRPLQVTDDLAGFWNGTWQEICKEMKGRYPKHNWDYRLYKE